MIARAVFRFVYFGLVAPALLIMLYWIQGLHYWFFINPSRSRDRLD